MLYGSQHAAPTASILTGTEPVEERLQLVLQELQQQGQQSQQQRQQKHARSSSLSCWLGTDPHGAPAAPCTSSGTHTSLAALSAKNRSGSFVPPGASPLSGIPLSILTTPLQGAINRTPLRSSSSSFAPPAAPPSPTSASAPQATFPCDTSQLRSNTVPDGVTSATPPAGDAQPRQPVHLDKKLSRSLGHARSILTGSSSENVLGSSTGCDGTPSTDAAIGGSAHTSPPTGLGGAQQHVPPRLQGGGGGSILDRVSPQPQPHAFQQSLPQQQQQLQQLGGQPSGSSMLLTGRAPSGEFTRSASGEFVRSSSSSGGVTGPKGSSGIGSGAPTLSSLFGGGGGGVGTGTTPAVGASAPHHGAHTQQGPQQHLQQRRSPPSLLLQQLHSWDPHSAGLPSTTNTHSSPHPWAAPTPPAAPGAAPHNRQPTPRDLTHSTPSPLAHPTLTTDSGPALAHSRHSTPAPTPSPPKPTLANGRTYDTSPAAGVERTNWRNHDAAPAAVGPSVERAPSPTTSARTASGAASPLHPSAAHSVQPHAHPPPAHTSTHAAGGAPPPQHRHKRTMSMCAALLTGAWDPTTDQPLMAQHQPQATPPPSQPPPHLQPAESDELLQQEGPHHTQLPQHQHHNLQQQQLQQQQSKSASSSAATTTTNTTANTVVLHDQLPSRLSQHEQQQGLHGLLQQAATAAAQSAQEQQQTQPQHSRTLPRPAPITAPPHSSYPPTSASTPKSVVEACSPTAGPPSHLQDPNFSYDSPPTTPPAAAVASAGAQQQHEREAHAQARAARLRQQHAAALEQQQGQRSTANAHAAMLARSANSPASHSKGRSTPPPSMLPSPPPSTPERSVSAHATFDSAENVLVRDNKSGRYGDTLIHDDTDAAHANAAAYEGDLSASAACASALHAPHAPSDAVPTPAPTHTHAHARTTTANSSSRDSAHHLQHYNTNAPTPRRAPLASIYSGHEMLQDARVPSPPLTPQPSSPLDRPTSRTRSRSRPKIHSSSSTQALSAMRSPPSSAPTTAHFDRLGGSMGTSVASSPASSALDAVLSPVALVNHTHSDRAATTGADRHGHGSSSRPHSRRTTSSSGTGSLYSSREEEGGGASRLPRSTRDRRAYYTATDDHQGSSHHSHSRSSMALLSANPPQSNASSRMATMAATQRHRGPAAPVGTTAAVAAVTGRPNNEGASTPLTSTGVMMGGFNAISHSRVRSIDLATDMLLGGGRGGRGSEGSSHSSRLQHHSSTQH